MPPGSQLAPARADRAALLVLQFGVLAVVLAALPYKAFDLDRYFVPKELVLHVCAAAAALLCLARRHRLSFARVDWLIVGFITLSTAAALFATNWWLAERALAISFSGAALFWVARLLRRGGLARPLLWSLALGGALAAATSLLQAFGTSSEYFSLNRSPGGTFGNRNFMAHLGAITAPTIAYLALTSRRSLATFTAALLLGIVAAAQVLSRTRAAWLAILACAVPHGVAAWLTRERWITRGMARRLLVLGTAASVGIIAALILPNELEWKSQSPYLESVRGIVNYQEGSGRGRLVQYTNSLRMTAAHPLLGVGPGNWGVVYPLFAGRNDPSLTSADDGMTANPWPSSDWVAFLSERGIPAVALLVLTLLGLVAVAAWHVRISRGAESLLGALALGGTVIATLVVGAFDAVLLLAAPALFVWTLLGALAEPASGSAPRTHVTRGVRHWVPVMVFVLGLIAAGRSALQIGAMALFTGGTRLADLEQASKLDPGSFRIHMRLAEAYLSRGQCDRARRHAHDARDLYPNAGTPRALLGACGEASARPRKR